MKRLVLALMLISFVNTYSKECTCGSFEVGLYDYEVKGDKGCCSETATGIGFFNTVRV